MNSGMAALGRTAAQLGLALGAAGLSKSIAQLGIDLEQTHIAFEVMIGDATKSKQLIKDLQQFANVTPFTNKQVIQSTRSLLAYSIEVENLLPTLRALGDISAGVGLHKMPNLILAYGQVRAATRLTGMELRQFTEAGVPLLDLLSQRLGKTVKVIKQEMIPAGEVSFQMVEQAIRDATSEGGRFFKMMQRQSKTTGGRISTLQGKLQLLGMTLGTQINPTIKDMTNSFINLVDNLPKLDFTKSLSNVTSMRDMFRDIAGILKNIGKLGGIDTPLGALQALLDGFNKVWRFTSTPLRLLLQVTNSLGDLMEDMKNKFAGLFMMMSLDPRKRAAGGALFESDKFSQGIQKFMQKEAGFWLGIKPQGSLMDRLMAPFRSALEGIRTAKGKSGVSGTAATGLPSSQLMGGISGSQPKNVILNITKLIETINFNDYKQNRNVLIEDVKRALMVALRDTVIANQ
jgi:tape measure domain-containing protein